MKNVHEQQWHTCIFNRMESILFVCGGHAVSADDWENVCALSWNVNVVLQMCVSAVVAFAMGLCVHYIGVKTDNSLMPCSF